MFNLAYAIPVFLLLLVLEIVLSLVYDLKLFTKKDTLSSLGMGVISTIVGTVFKTFIIITSFTFLYSLTPLRIGHEWWAWILCWLLVDFCFYWSHRFGHEMRIGWAAHVPHHSSEYYNLSTALRQSWTHFYFFIFYIPLPLLGFDPAMAVMVNLINTIYQFWIHTEVIGKLGPLEWIFNTPSHHRVHHGSNPQYIDKNYGGSLIIWDRIFGTFQKEEEKVVYGLTKNIKTYNLLRISFHEWSDMFRDFARAKTFSDKMNFLFNRPGWQPKNKVETEKNTISIGVKKQAKV